MSRFGNQSQLKTSKSIARQQTTNLAGGVAYSISLRSELLTLLVTSLLTDQFYRTACEQLVKLKTLVEAMISGGDAKFVAQAAIMARHDFGTRSITHAVAGEIARLVKGQTWTRRFFQKVIRRPDDILEILGYYMAQYKGAPIPNAMRRGLGAALSGLKEYEVAKYAKSNAALSMVDAVNLLHPKGNLALAKLIKGTLNPAETWETGLTQAGQKAKNEDDLKVLKADVWKTLLHERKLGYFALLRNLRNISTQAPECLDMALDQLVDEKAIKKSLVYPFRFLTAWDAVPAGPGANKIMSALSKAVEISLNNVPKLNGSGVVALDVSRSMTGHKNVATLFAAALVKKNGFDLLCFDGDARWMKMNMDAPLMALVQSAKFPGGSTKFESILDLIQEQPYRHMVIISDMQGWDSDDRFRQRMQVYKNKYNTVLYSLDISGHGSLKIPESQTFLMAGFNDKVFDVMAALESDPKAMESKALAVEV